MRSLETSSFRLSLQTLLRNKSAFVGTIIVILYFVDALVMEVYPKLFGITQPNSLVENFSSPLPPSFSHPLGTTAYGIDLLTSILKAIKFDLAYSLAVVLSGAALGVIIGVISGYVGGALDEFLMRITDIVFSIPYLVLALAVGFVIGRTYTSMVLALAIVW
jgi:peptide/nickel transport system permease protein